MVKAVLFTVECKINEIQNWIVKLPGWPVELRILMSNIESGYIAVSQMYVKSNDK